MKIRSSGFAAGLLFLPRIAAWTILFTTVLLLAACSMLRLGYGQADTIAAWLADDYFDLDARQRRDFLERFDRLLDWHRREQLPEYASFLTDAKHRLQNGLGREDIIWFVEGLKSRYRLIVRHGAADAAEMLMTITPAQLDALRRQWDKDNRKFIREYRLNEDVEERHRARAKRMIEQIEDWVGNLAPEQERMVTAAANRLPSIDRLRYEDRLRRQHEFMQLMRIRDDKGAFTARLRHWLLNWEERRTAEYDGLLSEWWSGRVQLLVDADRSLTARQREAALHRIQDYIDDFVRLSGRDHARAAIQ